MRQHSGKKRLGAVLLSLALCLSLLPGTALAADDVPYIGANGESLTQSNVTEVTTDTTIWSNSWYVAQGEVEISSRITVTGDVHLILADGCTLTVNGGINVAEGNSLTIYGQAEGTGELTATTNDNYAAGIGGSDGTAGGTVTIHGGTVTATGGINAAGISGGQGAGGTITIYGGMVTANSNSGAGIGGGSLGAGGTIAIYGGTVSASGGVGAGIGGGIGGNGGEITIYGGTVNASSSMLGAGIGGGGGPSGGAGGNVIITGGTVTATGGTNAAGIGGGVDQSGGSLGTAGSFSTGENGHAVIFASSIQDEEETSNPWRGVIFEGNSGQVYGKVTLEEDLSIDNGKTLAIGKGQTLTIKEDVTLTIEEGATLAIYDTTYLTGEGTLEGDKGTYRIASPLPSLSQTSWTYTGEDQFEKLELIADAESQTSVNVMDKDFSVIDVDEWTLQRTEIKNAGTYTVQAVFVGLTTSYSVTVNPATLTIDGATVADKTYDGDTDATVTSVTFAGLKNDETLTLGTDYTATGVFDDANADDNKEVTVTVNLSNKNYTFGSGEGTCTATASITPKEVSLTLTPDQSELSGGGTVTLTLTGDLPSDGTVKVACSDDAIPVIQGENNTWTATLPNQTAEYTFAATSGSNNYTVTGGTCTVSVTQYVPPANPNYRIDVTTTEGGTVTADPAAAKAGETVTLTPTPEEGYEVGEVTVADRFGDAVAVTENPDGTYTFTMPNGQVKVAVTFVGVQPEPLPFTDVNEGDWFYDAVQYVYDNGLMDGVGDGQFAPNATTTRAQLVTILYRLAGEPAVAGDVGFTDVADGLWYTDAVLWAAQKGIVNGISATEFSPSGDLTREQLATILYRYAEGMGYDVSASADLSGFPDARDIQSYATEALSWAVAEGLLQGFEDDSLQPQSTATRAQIATILMRFCEGVAE